MKTKNRENTNIVHFYIQRILIIVIYLLSIKLFQILQYDEWGVVTMFATVFLAIDTAFELQQIDENLL